MVNVSNNNIQWCSRNSKSHFARNLLAIMQTNLGLIVRLGTKSDLLISEHYCSSGGARMKRAMGPGKIRQNSGGANLLNKSVFKNISLVHHDYYNHNLIQDCSPF